MGPRVVRAAIVLAVFGLLPATAGARAKVVYAGGPVAWSNALASKTGAGVNNYLIDRVTINAGDSVVWNGKSLANGFHSVDIPALGGSDLPLILPTGKTVAGVLDAAGNPFWFNGAVPQLGFNPALSALSAGTPTTARAASTRVSRPSPRTSRSPSPSQASTGTSATSTTG